LVEVAAGLQGKGVKRVGVGEGREVFTREDFATFLHDPDMFLKPASLLKPPQEPVLKPVFLQSLHSLSPLSSIQPAVAVPIKMLRQCQIPLVDYSIPVQIVRYVGALFLLSFL